MVEEKSNFLSQESDYTKYINQKKKLEKKSKRKNFADFICPSLKLSKK